MATKISANFGANLEVAPLFCLPFISLSKDTLAIYAHAHACMCVRMYVRMYTYVQLLLLYIIAYVYSYYPLLVFLAILYCFTLLLCIIAIFYYCYSLSRMHVYVRTRIIWKWLNNMYYYSFFYFIAV